MPERRAQSRGSSGRRRHQMNSVSSLDLAAVGATNQAIAMYANTGATSATAMRVIMWAV